jgi:arylsulfatase A-like enzyme
MHFANGPEVTWASIAILLLGGLTAYIAAGGPVPVASQPSQPNIVMLVVDALRPDHLGCYGYGRPTSPHIDGLASDGVVFETAVSHAPWTKASFSSMLTSLYPFQHGVTDWPSVMPDSLATLPEVLARHGYSTACVMNTPALSGGYRILKGFEDVVVTEKVDRDAFKTSADAIEIIKHSEEPFFLMVHYSDVHRPYRPPWRYVDLVESDSEGRPFDRRSGKAVPSTGAPTPGARSDHELAHDMLAYDACLRLADDGIATLLAYLDEAGIRGRTAVVLTSDHGEAFWEHGNLSHASSVYDEEIRVPLILNYPARLSGPKRITEQVRHIDLLPTFLDIAGVTDTEHREGTSLVDFVTTGTRGDRGDVFLPPDATLCECTRPRAPATRCIRTDDWKLIVESLTTLRELYDLRNDPGETINLSGTGLAVEDSMLAMIRDVPGLNLGGWRIGLTGARPGTGFRVEVVVPQGTRLSEVRRFAAKADIFVDMRGDSTGFSFEAAGEDLNPLLFETEPRQSRVRFKISAAGDDIPSQAYVGLSETVPLNEEVVLAPDQAFGLPEGFRDARVSGSPGAYIWWFPGEGVAASREVQDLTPEQKKRLRALGYIQ